MREESLRGIVTSRLLARTNQGMIVPFTELGPWVGGRPDVCPQHVQAEVTLEALGYASGVG